MKQFAKDFAQTVYKIGYWPSILLVLWVVFTAPIGFPANTKPLAFDDVFEKFFTRELRRPFIYRALLPWSANALTATTPEPVAKNISSELKDIWHQAGFPANRSVELFYLYALNFACLVAWLFLFRHLMGLLNYSASFIDVTSFVSACGLMFFLGRSFFYDHPAMMFFTLLLVLMQQQNWPAYLAILAVGTLNKETTVLIIPVFALTFYSKIPHIRFAKLLVVQIAIYGAVRVWLMWLYANNGGVVVENHFFYHFEEYQYYYWSATGYFLSAVVLSGLAFYRLSQKATILQNVAKLAWIPLILYFAAGMPFEVRVFLEIYPVIMLLAADSLAYLWKQCNLASLALLQNYKIIKPSN